MGEGITSGSLVVSTDIGSFAPVGWERASRHALSIVVVICGIWVAFAYPAGTWPNSLADLTIDPSDFLGRLAASWDTRLLLGQDNGFALPYVPIAVAAAYLKGLGLPLWVVGRIGIAAVIVGAGLSMTVLTRTFYPFWRIGHWIAAFAYMANIFVWVFAKDAIVLLIPYAATPLAIAMFTKGLRRTVVRGAALVALTSLLFIAISPSGSAIAGIVVIAFALAALLRASPAALNKRVRWRAPLSRRLRYVLLCTAFTAAVNVWWIIPLFRNLAFHTNVAAKSVENPFIDDAYSSYGEVLRLMGNPALYSGWQGQPYYPDGPAYVTDPMLIILTYALPVLGIAGIAVMFYRRVPYARVLAGLLIVALVLAAGIQPPTGQLYLWLYDHAPGAIAFRASYRWVGVLAFVYALGAAFACEAIRRPTLRDATVWVAVAAILAQGWPMFSGAIVPPRRLYTIPNYWFTFANWANAQSGSFRIAYLPGQYFSVYTWGQPLGEPATILVHHPGIVAEPGPPASTDDGSLLCNALLGDLISGEPQSRVVALLAVLDVRYVVERRDVDVNYYGEAPPNQVTAALARFDFLHKIASFGELDVYSNSLWTETALRASGKVQPIEQPIVYDEVRLGGGSWATNTATLTAVSLSDFALHARISISSGQYLGLGLKLGDHFVVAELRTDGSRLEHSIGNTFVPFGTSVPSQAEIGRYYEITFARAGAKYVFAVDGTTVATGEDNDTRAGNIYLVGYSSSVSVARLDVDGGAKGRYTLPLLQQDVSRKPSGWSAAPDTWIVRPMPLAQAVTNAFYQHVPAVLAEPGPSAPSWSGNLAEYNAMTMADFTASINFTLREGSAAAIGFKTKTDVLLGELRSDGSRIETTRGATSRELGTSVGYRVEEGSNHVATLSRRGSIVELSVDGQPVARATNAPIGLATFIMSTFQAGISVSDVSITSSDGHSYVLDRSHLAEGPLPAGWRAPASWSVSKAYPTVDSPSSAITTPIGAPTSSTVTASEVDVVSSDVSESRAILTVRANGPFYITLDAPYDRDWAAYIPSSSVAQTLDHFEALGYANGWFVPYGGTLTIVMDYRGNTGWSELLAGWVIVTVILAAIILWPQPAASRP